MNDLVRIGQAPAGSIAPVKVKLIKPAATTAQVIPVTPGIVLDLTDIAAQGIVMVHAGDRLIILFADRSAIVLGGFYGPNGRPIEGLEVDTGQGGIISAAQIASVLPISEDASILPAAGPASLGGTLGSSLAPWSASVGGLDQHGRPLDLLAGEGGGAGPESLGQTGQGKDNTPTTLTGAFSGDVTEDLALATTGVLTIHTVDGATVAVQTKTAGLYGAFSVDAAGTWSYALDNANGAVQALGAGHTLTESFTVKSTDGDASETVTITINGTNDIPVLGEGGFGSVAEDVILTTGGTLAIHDVDTGESSFIAQAKTVGLYGSFALATDGSWTYTLDNNNSAVQALGEGQSLFETFTAVSFDGTATETIAVVVIGTNDVPLLGGEVAGAVTEDGVLVATGTLTIADVDTGQSVFAAQLKTAGSYGTFSLTADGSWTYTLDNGSTAVQALGAGQTATDTFTAISSDGTASEIVTVTITGTNDVPVLGGNSAGTVKEDTTLSVTGVLTIVDVDSGESNFVVQTGTVGSYGTFAVDSAGAWSYTLANDSMAVQALGASSHVSETFTVWSSDLTASKTVTVSIDGTNDVPVLGGTSAGTVKEDTTLSVTGVLTIVDVDSGESNFVAQAGTVGSYGTFSVDTAGAWSYTLANGSAAVQALGGSTHVSETFTVWSSDLTASKMVTVSIDGTNDVPVLSGVSAGTVKEDTTLSATGVLTIVDVDSGESNFTAQSGTVGSYGSFSVTASGVWTYTLANSDAAVQALGGSTQVSESFTVWSSDHTASQTVTVTINGTNDVPTLYGVTSGSVTEDSIYSAGSNLYITDKDTGEAVYAAQTNTAGTYGTFSITAAGAWTYTLDNASAAVQALPAGTNPSETFKVWSSDHSASINVTVTVKGANDVPTLGGNIAGSVTEDSVLTATGLLTVSDPDSGQSSFTAQAGTVGSYGTFVVTTAGAWTYTLANSGVAVQGLGINSHPTETFTVWSSDHTASETVTVTINGTNDAPSGANKTVTTLEDTAYTFLAADFGFADSEGDRLAGVKFTQLPGAGSLVLNGVAVSANQTVSASDIAAGLLKFAPAANANGASYATFQFAVQDNGGTAHGGVDIDQSPNTITVSVTAVNDAPAGADKTITAIEDKAYAFTTADFGFTDAIDNNALLGVKITQLPGVGSLTLNGIAVTANQVVTASSITSGLLKFTAAANANGDSYATLQFAVQDNGGTANGGVDLDQSPNTITLNVAAVNDAPAGAGKTITTLEDTAYTFSKSDFGFTDPDGNALLGVKIAALPGTGSLTLNGVAVALNQTVSASDITSGLLQFTPAANSTSGTSFRFQVQDDGGTANGGIDLDPSQRTISVSVTAVNDAPVLDASKNVTITTVEDAATPASGTAGTLVSTIADRIIDGSGFDNVTDVDSSIAGIAVVGQNTSQGTWYYSVNNGTSWSVIGAVSDTTALLLRPEYLLYFKPSANYAGTISDAITFRAWDVSGGTPGQYINVTSNGGSTPYSVATDTVSVTVTGVNDAPTIGGLTNASIAENQTGALVRTFTVSDIDTASGLTFRVLDAANAVDSRFVVVAASGTVSGQPGTYELRLVAGQSLDFEVENADGNPTIALKVEVNDNSGANNLATAPITVTVSNVNEAPTAVAFNNATTSIAENTSTASAIKVADIAVTDDALGTNGLTLSGADAASFQIVGNALYLKAGVTLDYETKASYNFTVNVDDTTVGATPDLTKSFTLVVTDVNEAPTAVTFSNTTTALAENTSTVSAIKVADIAVTDDALGTNMLTLSGADAANFQIVGNALYLKAGVTLDYETKASYNVAVNVDDTTVGATPDLTKSFTLTVTDVNEAPTAVAFTNVTSAIAENTPTPSPTKVADIVVTDDALGTNTFSLSGADAASFQIIGNALYLKAGVTLDYETKTSYNVIVNVDDTTVGATPDLSKSFTLTVIDVFENHAPTAVDDAIFTGGVSEDVVTSFATSLLTGNDTDPDSDSLVVTAVSALSAKGAAVLFNSVTGQISYDPSHAAALQALNAGDSTTDTFTYTISDGHGGTATATATVTISGMNDAAVITGVSSGSVTEAGAAVGVPSVTGDLNSTDVDNPADSWKVVAAATGSVGGYGTYTIDATGHWTYTLDNSNATVNALAAGSVLSDSFTVQTIDGTAKVVAITINGGNDLPVAKPDSGAMTEGQGPTVFNVLANDTLDPDTGAANTISAGVVTVYGGTKYGLDASDLAVTVTSGGLQVALVGTDWDKLGYGASLPITINYTLTGNAGDTASNQLTLTVTGINDAPVLDASISPVMSVNENDGFPVGTVGTAVPTLAGLVSAGGIGNVTDVDITSLTPTTGMTITYLDASHGTWFVSADGVSWLPVAATAISDTHALLLNANYSLYFQPTANYAGTIADAITFRAWDYSGNTTPGGYGDTTVNGGTSPYSTATDTVSLTVNSVNVPAVISGTSTGAVTEAGGVTNATPGTPSATGDLNSTDADGTADAWQAVTTATASTGGYGTYAIDATGHWTYTLDNSNATVGGLIAGGTLSDTFTVQTTDGTSQVVTVTITGANDVPVLGGVIAGSVTEDASPNTATGALTITDVDSGQSTFATQINVAGSYGSFSLDAAGHWTYTLDNTKAAVQALGLGQTLTENFTATSSDGTEHQGVTVTVNGANDAPVLNNSFPITITMNEDSGPTGPFVSTFAHFGGSAVTSVTDADGSVVGIAITHLDSSHGTWSWSTNNGATWTAIAAAAISDSNALLLASNYQVAFQPDANYNGTVSDALLYRAWDQTSGVVLGYADTSLNGGTTAFSSAVEHIGVTVLTVNDPAVITGTTTGAVIEAGGVANATPGTPIATGDLDSTDIDNPADSWQAVTTATASTGGKGTYTIDATGHWSYTLNNSNTTVDGLATGATLSDTFTVKTVDGTSQVVAVTITGANDAPVLHDYTIVSDTYVGSYNVFDGPVWTTNPPVYSAAEAAALLFGGVASDYDISTNSSHDPSTITHTGWYDELGVGKISRPEDFKYDAGTPGFNDPGTLQSAISAYVADDTHAINYVWRASPATTEDATYTVAGSLLLANASDVDVGDTLSLSAVSALSAHGATVTLVGGNVVYDPTASTELQALAAGAVLTDTFTYTVSDNHGGTATATVTLTTAGVNDVPVLAGATTGAVTEDDTLTATGALTITDADTGQSSFAAQTNTAGSHGSFSVTAAGAWTYTLNNADSAVQALNSGQTLTDSFLVASSDGSASETVIVTINGTNDAAASININLNNIALGVGGFKIIGENANDLAGQDVASAGDVNGDGYDDVIVGAYLNSAAGSAAGAAYVVYGGPNTALVNGVINLDTVATGTGGFKIIGQAAGQEAGIHVSSAGDVNNDGYADMLVTALNGNAVYVVYGGSNAALANGVIDLDSVASDQGGFKIVGENVNDAFGSGLAAAGDVNGDGYADFILGAYGNPAGGTYAGAAYVIYGGPNAAPTGGVLDLHTTIAAGIGGFKIVGENAFDLAGGNKVSSAGDLNGDGYDDLIVGAYKNDAGGTDAGAAYVVYGGANAALVNGVINLDTVATGVGGFKIVAEGAGDAVGITVDSAGDVNGDGINDLIVGAYGDDTHGAFAGAAYVIYGGSNPALSGGTLSLATVATGTGGFKIVGEASPDNAGFWVSSAGDVNGDGFADVIVGAANNGGSGAAYVVYGGVNSAIANGIVDLAVVASGTGGFKVIGEAAGDSAGGSVSSAGDVNGDGYDDIIIGAKLNDEGGNIAGAAYVIYGGSDLPNNTAAHIAGTDTGAMKEDVSTAISGVLTVTEPNLTAGTFTAETLAGSYGSFALQANGTWTYTLNNGNSAVQALYDGDHLSESFKVTSADGTAVDTVSITIHGTTDRITSINLDNIALGQGGFKIIGENAGDAAGYSVASAGDINGDGYDDLIIGAYNNDAGGTNAGAAYVVYGKASAITSVDLDAVAVGTDGFKITGENAGDAAGYSVASAGDINGDGYDDLIIGADLNDAGGLSAGAAYVVYGRGGAITSVNLDAIAAGTGGFKITGEAASDFAGVSVSSAGDINRDGIDDLLIGASGNSAAGLQAGAAYVVFGQTSAITSVNLDAVVGGTGGFKITAEADYNFVGYSVAAAGDINGDGLGDMIISAYGNSANGAYAGAAYVIYGQLAGLTSVNLGAIAAGTGGFKITGEFGLDYAGVSVASAGDINGDGYDDLIIGATGNDAGGPSAGAAYVVYGQASAITSVNLAAVAVGTDGFKIIGENGSDGAGYSVASAGDVNGDGYDDLIVGANTNDAGGSNAGAAYVIYGTASAIASVNLDAVAAGTGGFKIIGENALDQAGVSVASAGDLNGDGYDDLIVGADHNDAGGADAGAAYVIYGGEKLGGQSGLTLTGAVGTDTLTGKAGNDILTGGGGADILTGGLGADTFHYTAVAEGGDTIKDFTSGEDLISIVNSILGVSDLGSLNFDGTVGSSPIVLFEQVANATTAASNNSTRLIFDTSGHNLYYDGDGGASASGRTLLAHLEHAGMIEASNIVLTAG